MGKSGSEFCRRIEARYQHLLPVQPNNLIVAQIKILIQFRQSEPLISQISNDNSNSNKIKISIMPVFSLGQQSETQ